MRVLTLNNNDFEAECRRLEDLTRAFDPDLIIGIASGGAFVAANIFAGVPHLTVVARRPSTDRKERVTPVMRVVRHLPRPVRDLLRIAESRLLSLRKAVPFPVPPISVSPDVRRILVVDDAVDSGSTLAGVLAALPRHIEVKSAVITITTRRPIAVPDYSLYNNRTLIRFPWSKDNNPR